MLIATIEPPQGMNVTGRGCLIQARLCRPKRAESRGDQQAKEVSDGLPFLEYELHRQLINKLRTKGMNSIFGLKVFWLSEQVVRLLFFRKLVIDLTLDHFAGASEYRRTTCSWCGYGHSHLFQRFTLALSAYAKQPYIYKAV